MKRRSKAVRMGMVLCVLLVAISLAGATGVPQELGVELILGRVLDAKVDATDVSVLGTFRAKEIRVFLPGTEIPLALAKDVRVRYGGETWLREIIVGSLHLELDEERLDFLEGSVDDSEPSDKRFQPEKIGVRSLSGHFVSEYGALDVTGIEMSAVRLNDGSYDMSGRSSAFSAEVSLDDGAEEFRIEDARFEVSSRSESNATNISFEGDFPDYGEAAGVVSFTSDSEETQVSATFDTLRLEGTHLSRVIERHLGFPATFESVEVAPFEFSHWIASAPLHIPMGSLEFSMTGLRLGEEELRYFDGDVDIRAEGEGTDSSSGKLEVSTSDGQRIVIAAQEDENGILSLNAELVELDATPWGAVLAGGALPGTPQGRVRGTLYAKKMPGEMPLNLRYELFGEGLSYNDRAYEPLHLTGVATLSASGFGVEDARAELVIEGVTTLRLTNWSYENETGRGGGDISFTTDVERLGVLLGTEDAWGEVSGEAKVELDGDMLVVPVTFSTDYLGYGDLSVPYGTELKGALTLRADTSSLTARIEGGEIAVGDGTRLRLEEASLIADPPAFEGRVTLESDLQLAVEMGWLKEVSGSLGGEAQLVYVEESGFVVDWLGRADIEQSTLSFQSAEFSSVSFTGSGKYDEGLRGDGEFRAGMLVVAGARVSDVTGTFVLADGVLLSDSLEGSLFDGRIEAAAQLSLSEEDLAIDTDVQFDSLSLARLTEEVEPPAVRLTGTAEGYGRIVFGSNSGLEAFSLNVSSRDGLSLNRDLVEEILSGRDFLGSLSEGRMRKTLDKFLGSKPQRPFEEGELRLGLRDGRFIGEVLLLSDKTKDYNGLDLRVDLAVDPESLGESLLLLQEASQGGGDE